MSDVAAAHMSSGEHLESGGGALAGIRVCDFGGQLAGAGATRILAAFGAHVVRVEDPSNRGTWDILRGGPPYADERRGIELGGAFNNHNVEKMSITLDLRRPGALDVLHRLVAVSDVVTENFAAGALARRGVTYDWLTACRHDIIYVSSSGFGHTGPYATFKSWGPIVQAISGLTSQAGLAGAELPAGWGFSYMDHQGAYFMALAVLSALRHRHVSGRGQWIDMSTTEVAMSLLGPELLDYTVNGRSARLGERNSNRSTSPLMAPHGVYPARGDDEWIAIACRHDADWVNLVDVIDAQWARDRAHETVHDRVANEDDLDRCLSSWTGAHDKHDLARLLQRHGVPAAAVQKPCERIDADENTRNWGLWPEVEHPVIGRVRVDGLPLHASRTDWRIERGAPTLGQHNDLVYGDLLGYSTEEIGQLRQSGTI